MRKNTTGELSPAVKQIVLEKGIIGTVVSVLLRNPDLAAVPELLFRHEPEYQQRAQCGVRAGGICIK